MIRRLFGKITGDSKVGMQHWPISRMILTHLLHGDHTQQRYTPFNHPESNF
jgi:hypothetical protein